ncbi:hypothetical protein M378DRAFT_19548 [Amanita muscaria Koide BX008]|uniref:Uncharacterized protein n=1 Tax=Amanita muscaria (strain Koide BX008) TaxID=946122 RepID=A0A0C2SIL6_AMAMK|nr:hypothetical protein M378DRAFT_19548 [Amanita muscaria Koide BX008]
MSSPPSSPSQTMIDAVDGLSCCWVDNVWTTPLGDASNQLWYIMQGDTMSQPIVFATFPLPVLAQKHPNQRKMLKISRIGLHGSSDCFKLSSPIVLWIARRRNSQMKQQSSFFLPSVPTLKVLTNRSI